MKHEIETKYNIGDPHFTAVDNKLVECFISVILVESTIDAMRIHRRISYEVIREFSEEEIGVLKAQGHHMVMKPIIGIFKEKDILPEPQILRRNKS